MNTGRDILLSVCDDGWHGASNIAELTAASQIMEGTILVGDNSILTMTLGNGSSFEGTFSGEIENAKGQLFPPEIGAINVVLDSTSTWTLTSDTYIASFEGDASRVIGNGYILHCA